MQVIQPASEGTTAFQLSPTLQSKLVPIGEEANIFAGETLFHQGSACRGAYLLRTGAARIYLLNKKGQMVTCRNVGPGCILGLPATLCEQPYMFTAESTEACTFSFIPSEKFQEFLRTNPDLCMEVVQLMSRELATVNGKRTEAPKCKHIECSLRDTCSHLAN